MKTRYLEQLAEAGESKTERETVLEDIYNDEALKWVDACNQQTLKKFTTTPTFQTLHATIRSIREDKHKIPRITLRDGYIYEVWKDAKHPQGLWRRTTIQEFKKANPHWENLLDIDNLPEEKAWHALLSAEALAHNPNGSWVWDTPITLGNRTLVGLSYGGSDSSVYREFDLEQKKFVDDGFETKLYSGLHWCDANSLWLTDYDYQHLTSEGRPAYVVKRWQRAERSQRAKVVYRQTEASDLFAEVRTYVTSAGRSYPILERQLDFHHQVYYLVDNKDFTMTPLDLPRDATLKLCWQDEAVFLLKSAWVCPNGHTYAAGSVLMMNLAALQDKAKLRIEAIFTSTENCVVHSVYAARDFILVSALNHINGVLYRCHFNKTWHCEKVPLPEMGQINIESCYTQSNECLIKFESFITPPIYYYCDLKKQTIEVLKAAPACFDGDKMVTQQYWATSQDGTKIPYYAVHLKSVVYNGNNPTLLNAYGGFGDSLLPSYLDTTGKCWLERGGVCLFANIRGGAEFGPQWHLAVLKENRHKCFEDFIAVAEDAIERDITSPRYLGISGSSNGGLLVGVAMTQRPDLFNAVVCNVPLLDMVNYSGSQLNGEQWVAEYGDPANRDMRHILQSYSPYHNVKNNRQYPEALFMSSTKDDRVHPGHARKMVDRMQAQGHHVYYYEAREGGHTGRVNLVQDAFVEALEQSYLYQKLMRPKLTLQENPSARSLRRSNRQTFFKPSEAKPDTNIEVDLPPRKRQKQGGN
jgi:prolyl oligopeptidase